MDRYSFDVELSHLLLHAGLSRRTPSSRRHPLNVPRPIHREVPRGRTPGSSPLPSPSPGLPRARLLLLHPQAGTNDAAGFASCCGPLSRSPNRGFDAGPRPGPSPDRAASPLPGLLAATRTGLTPAGDDELALDQVTSQHHLQLWAHKEQDVEPLPEDRVDGEEVALKDCGRLLTQELPPADARSSRCGLDPVPVKNVPNTARRQRQPQRDQLALDALVSPARVL